MTRQVPGSSPFNQPEPRRREQSFVDQAYAEIRAQILRGEFTFGSVLPRRELAERLGMSYLPITQALQRLEQDGLVESRPKVGTRVRIPSADEILGLWILREALESQAARLCAERASDAERRELRGIAAQLDKLYPRNLGKPGDSEQLFKWHNLNVRLHTRIAECARCQVLFEAIERNHVLIFTFLYDMAAKVPTIPAAFHRDLVEAIVSDSPEKADAAMRQHIRFGADETLLRLAPYIRLGQDAWRLDAGGRSEFRNMRSPRPEREAARGAADRDARESVPDDERPRVRRARTARESRR